MTTTPKRGRGRPKKADAGVPHLARPSVSARRKLEVTWGVVTGFPNLDTPGLVQVIEDAVEVASGRFGLSVISCGVKRDEIEVVCSAHNKKALARGLQGLSIRAAKGLNRALGRRGRVFADRYAIRAVD